MREIKFRLVLNNKIVGYENWLYSKDNRYWNPDFIWHKEKNQYTGSKDRNSKEIWEGDIFKWQLGCVESIVWDEELNGWNIDKAGLTTGEVIGNIYENPELLKER